MASNDPTGDEGKDKATSDEKVHVQDGPEEFVEGKSNSTSERKREEIMEESKDTVRDEAKAEVNEELTDPVQDFFKEANEKSMDEAKDTVRDEVNVEANEEARDIKEANEKSMDEAKDTVRDEVNVEANEEARDIKEANEKSMDEAKDTVRGEVNVEANEEARDIKETNEKSMDEAKDTVSEEVNVEANDEARDMKEANEKSMDEAKDTIRGEAKADTHEEARDETKDIDNHETNDEVRDDTKGDTRELTIDAERPEARDGIRCDNSDEAACDDTKESLETGQDENKDDSISIDEDIWRYILKTKDWTNRISSLKEELEVEIEESTSDVGMTLRVSGLVKSNVERAQVDLGNLISTCQDIARTVEVLCNDNNVHSKVVRLLKSINKLPCYVSAAPELIRVTGTKEEIRSCLEKLETYGVRYEFEKKDVTMDGSDVPEEQIPPEKFMVPPLDNSQQESLTRELPVPIEKHLWHFIREKRKSALRELEEGFGVTISTKPTNNVATVTVAISLLSTDNTQMLDLAEVALGQLLERLGLQVVVTCVLGGEGVAKMPQEVLNMLRQDLADVDVILEVIESPTGQRPGHRLLLVGPDKEIALSQQTIKSAFEKLCGSVDPALFNDAGMSNIQQMFPGPGNRLGSNQNISSANREHSGRDNHSHGHAGPTTAIGGPPLRGNTSINGEIHGSARPNQPASRVSGQGNTSEQPKVSKETPLRVSGTSQTQSGRTETSSDPCCASQKSSEQRPESSSKTEGKAAKKVTFSDANDGIRVYPSDSPPSVNTSKPGTESDVTNRPEPKDRHCPENSGIGSRNKSDESCTKNGHHTSLCSACKGVSEAQRVNGCTHVLCLACVKDYMAPAAPSCPLCDNSGRPTAAATQPIGGQMLITHNNACRLPGLEKNSKGIIIITYFFKPGYQADDCQNPGKSYPGLTKTAFLPLSPDGSKVLDLLQKAFEARVTFRLASTPIHPSGELVWNEIVHKESIYGGPKGGGFPDPVYMERVRQDLLAKGFQ